MKSRAAPASSADSRPGIDYLCSALPVSYSAMFIIASATLAIAVGMIAGILPAMRAAGIEPVEARTD